MKKLLRYKKFDLCMQFAAIIAPFAIAVISNEAEKMLSFYLIVGVTQALSAIINSGNYPLQLRHHTRKAYGQTVWTMLAIVVLLTITTGILGFVILLILPPFLALWYLLITVREVQLLQVIIADGIE
jgi:hypothetical protein